MITYTDITEVDYYFKTNKIYKAKIIWYTTNESIAVKFSLRVVKLTKRATIL